MMFPDEPDVHTTATEDNGETTNGEISDCEIFSEPARASKRKYRKSYGNKSPSSKSPSFKKVARDKCPCSKVVEDSCFITCVSCDQCFHCNCVGLAGLKQNSVDNILSWKCHSCFKPNFDYKLGSKNEHIDLRAIVQEEVKNACATTVKDLVVSATHEAVGKATEGLVEKVSKKTNESVKTFAEVTLGKSKEAQKKIIEDVKEATASTVVIGEVCRKMDSDQVERERRKCNVIINKVPESNGSFTGKERRDHDVKYLCENLDMNMGVIKTCFRVGASVKNAEGIISPRPLVVVMKDEETAQYWHDYGRGYHFENPDLWVNPDLCRTDRHTHFLMRQERRTRLKAAIAVPKQHHQQEQHQSIQN